MKVVTVKSQKEFDELDDEIDRNIIIVEYGNKKLPALIMNQGLRSKIIVKDSYALVFDSVVHASGSSYLLCHGECIIFASDTVYVGADKHCKVIASGSAKIEASGYCSVYAHDNVEINVIDHSFVDAYDNTKVTADDKSLININGDNVTFSHSESFTGSIVSNNKIIIDNGKTVI